MSGRYVHTRSHASDFMIPNFVSEAEVASILPSLPNSDVSRKLEDKLQLMGQHVPRHVGRPLLQKMSKFWHESQKLLQEHAVQLDQAHSVLADVRKFTYGSLAEFTTRLLGKHAFGAVGGRPSGPALLAVHQALTKVDSYARVQTGGSLRGAVIYELSAIRDTLHEGEVIRQVERYRYDSQHGTRTSSLHRFVDACRSVIDSGRKCRSNTGQGLLGPFVGGSERVEKEFRQGVNVEPPAVLNDNKSLRYLVNFLMSWSALGTVSTLSPMNGMASTILRALDRYPGEILDQRTGWKFLQEMGFIAPWETQQAYVLRLPLTGFSVSDPRAKTLGIGKDRSADIRVKHSEEVVYCIDDITAMEIDDGVSLTRTEKSDEYWVNVHIADPASYIRPDSDAASFAESQVGNTYLPDRVTTMLQGDFVTAKGTLAPGRACLTFSMLMNARGDVLNTSVRAGRLSASPASTVYLTPSTFASIGGEGEEKVYDERTVNAQGEQPAFTSRTMSGPFDLNQRHKEDLAILHRLSRARDAKMQTRGTTHFNQPQPHLAVSFQGENWQPISGQVYAARQFHGDPSITLRMPNETDPVRFNKMEKVSAVARLMLSANEVAAKWCYERNIPIPYRKTDSDKTKNPREYYAKHIKPVIDAGGKLSETMLMNYYNQIGRARLSTTPGPHSALGVDMIAKATSPLRRYPDLLLHWQIGAALLHEAKTGKSLVGAQEEDLTKILPFTRAQIEEKIPRIDIRERAITRAHRQANRAWLCQFLVRAWKFGQAELPKRLKWRCADMRPTRDENGFPAKMGTLLDFATLSKLVLPEDMMEDDITPGDEWEVELEEVDCYNLNIFVKPVRRWVDQVEA